ncbi:MAG: endonuclease III domain-containing protein [Gammaproteobacteria bacterium]|jgi:endonuclease-3 related protein|nr:endonuclease III domain-containing protein [Gammaproteobacteria bacterium]MBT4607240.1 endonuclease III domain-containing protein [Thiotrichales bacterium]MBT3472794.1 endonuclease III domain-containing protein [Gammaproteobacteria bacterium]MBT3967564.1 endonuclease III domain-containing protein [Gammaproteobacteria bacterium]MBT4080060.1 endonuclease III domain-containing protein [Gammaproteobacteria bacterium]
MAEGVDPLTVFEQLQRYYGPQQWWPAESPFEVMVGAILTQNTTWSGVEKAIANLRSADALSLQAILALSQSQLGELIRPSGYFNLKSKRLQNFCRWYQQHQSSAWEMETRALRVALLEINGVGPETADDILLYAFERPVFVVDSYTRRIFERLGWLQGGESYDQVQERVESCFTIEESVEQVRIFNELHGMIVSHAKQHCRKKPLCEGCPLVGCSAHI